MALRLYWMADLLMIGLFGTIGGLFLLFG
jgi:hypothetical protein